MLYFGDMVPGTAIIGPNKVVELEELIEFARIWDPLPQHIDENIGQQAFGTLTAPGIYILALKQRLIHQLDEQQAVIASLGYDEVRFHKAVHPTDCLTLKLEWIKRRLSKSKKDRGIVTVRFSLLNQNQVLVMSHLDSILVRRKETAINKR